MKEIMKTKRFEAFARVFRKPWAVMLVIAVQFAVMEIIVFTSFLHHLPIYERIAFYGTLISSVFVIYASVACRSYIRSGGDTIYRENARIDITLSLVVYSFVLSFLVAIALL